MLKIIENEKKMRKNKKKLKGSKIISNNDIYYFEKKYDVFRCTVMFSHVFFVVIS